jgi:hypothetical protein
VARQVAALIAGLVLAAAAGLAGAKDPDRLKTPQIPWTKLSVEERRVLEPVARDWPGMPGYQQQRLQGAARKYPSLQPIQKERFDTRIRDWAAMTPDQRKAARETFQGMRKLPPEKQHELRERWLERHGNEGQGAPHPTTGGERRYSTPTPAEAQRAYSPPPPTNR